VGVGLAGCSVHRVERLLDESLKGGMFYLGWKGEGEGRRGGKLAGADGPL
jgi:hypothetical protein